MAAAMKRAVIPKVWNHVADITALSAGKCTDVSSSLFFFISDDVSQRARSRS